LIKFKESEVEDVLVEKKIRSNEILDIS